MKTICALLTLCLAQFSIGAEILDHKRVACTALRDHANSPTYSFELLKQSDGTFTARYLNIPGKDGTPPQIVASINKLKCRFLKKPSFLFQCQKFGASVESIRVLEEKLSLSTNKVHRDYFREFRAVGIEVEEGYQNFRFGDYDICVVQ